MLRYREIKQTESKKQLSECLLKSITDCTIGYDIDRIEAKIHRVILSGEKIKGQKLDGLYDWDTFKGIFPNAGINYDFVPDERMPNYNVQFTVDTDEYKLNFFTYRKEGKGFCPPFYMDVTPKGNVSPTVFYKSLADLDKVFPKMCVSSVEYAIDIFCDSPKDVEWLFFLLRRTLFVPYAKEAKMKDEKSTTWDEKIGLSFTQHYGRDTKIYPRGDDDDFDDKEECWPYDKLNRVRLEYTPNRRELKNITINTLTDLLLNCKFQEISGKVYSFNRFEGPENYPEYYESDWSNYSAEDGNGNKGAFQNEYVMASKDPKTKNNYRKYVVDIEDFELLKGIILTAMVAFDSDWKAQCIL